MRPARTRPGSQTALPGIPSIEIGAYRRRATPGFFRVPREVHSGPGGVINDQPRSMLSGFEKILR
jgi:hypothetical protein